MAFLLVKCGKSCVAMIFSWRFPALSILFERFFFFLSPLFFHPPYMFMPVFPKFTLDFAHCIHRWRSLLVCPPSFQSLRCWYVLISYENFIFNYVPAEAQKKHFLSRGYAKRRNELFRRLARIFWLSRWEINCRNEVEFLLFIQALRNLKPATWTQMKYLMKCKRFRLKF